MNKVEFTAKTIEEAIAKAVDYFKEPQEKLEIQVLEKESKGLLGIFGSKDAKIAVSLPAEEVEVVEEVEEVVQVEESVVKEEKAVSSKEEIATRGKEFLENILHHLGLKTYVESKWEDGGLLLNIEGENLSLVIGKRGKNLDALQYLVAVAVNQGQGGSITHVLVDCENYRQKRKESLIRLAKNRAERAKSLRKDIILNPMNSYERKIIHSALQHDRAVSTRSEGKDPNRKVIIFLNR